MNDWRQHEQIIPFVCVGLRCAIGLFFVGVGLLKIFEPTAKFEAVIASYQILPDALLRPAALLLPWIEFFLGLFFLLGLWTVFTLRALLALVCVFFIALVQAQARGLLGDDCGCFGEGWRMKPWMTALLDAGLLIVLGVLHTWRRFTVRFSMDEIFSETDESGT